MEQKRYKVLLAQRADRMLLSHTKFLAQVSPVAARRLLMDFKKTTRLLAANPFQFPFADEVDALGIPTETYRKCLLDERYKAIFLVEDNNVYIDAVIDCRQDNKNLF